MRRRVRMYGYSVGQVNETLLDEYKEYKPYKRDVVMLAEKIESEILGHPIKGLDDILEAEKYVKRIGYYNIGEMLEAIIRQELMTTRQICMNCRKYKLKECERTKSKYYSCENGKFAQ